MLTTLRRFLVVQALLFWQGGFLFYAAVVVPIGTAFLGTPLRQGGITRQVTSWMNIAGAGTLLLLALDVGVTRDPKRVRCVARWGLWLLMAVGLAALFWLHPRMDALFDVAEETVHQRSLFKPMHRAYLWISTVQWASGLLWVWLTLAAWAAESGRQTPASS
jgi:hypothetical protein